MPSATIDASEEASKATVRDRVVDGCRQTAHFSREARLVKSPASDAVEDGVHAAKRAITSVKRGVEELADLATRLDEDRRGATYGRPAQSGRERSGRRRGEDDQRRAWQRGEALTHGRRTAQADAWNRSKVQHEIDYRDDSGVGAHATAGGRQRTGEAPERCGRRVFGGQDAPDKGIPRELLEKVHCIVIVPDLKTAAFVVGGKYGKGYLSCRNTKRAGWSAPGTVRIEGGSVGFQIGAPKG